MSRYRVQIYADYGTDLESILINLGMHDNDLNGDNGDEYLWWETEENGYKTNLEWLLDQVKDVKNAEEKVDRFLKLWFSHDDYYQDYQFYIDYLESKEYGKVYFVSVAVNTYC